VLVGTSLGLLGVYNSGNKKKKMRIFDNLTTDVKIDILETAIAYAKQDIANNNLQVDLIEHACGFGEMFFLQPIDFSLIEPVVVTSWIGSIPRHIPRYW